MLESKSAAGFAGSIEEALMGAIQDPNVHIRLRAVADAARVLDPEMLIDAMADQHDAVRRNAAIEVLARGGPRSVPTLIRALRHPDPEVVMFAAGVLGRTRDPSAVPHLIALLEHDDINIAQGAIESLARLRAVPSVEPLISALDKDPWLRFAAVHALGEIGDARAVSPLVGLLDDDSIAEAAIAALGRIGTVEALTPLAERLSKASDDETFVMCLRALGDALEQQPDDRALDRLPCWKWLGSAAAKDVHLRLLEVLSTEETGLIPSSDSLILQCAAAYLVRALRLQPLYGALVRAGREPLLRDVLQFCILSIGVEIANALAGNITNADANVRILACRCAGALALPKLAPLVEKLLADEREAVRAVAVQALARIAREAALPAIVPMLADADEEVRSAAAIALHAMNAEATTKALLAQPLRELHARLLAADIMRANPHAAQRPMLLTYLTDSNAAVRRAAIAALARQPGADYVDAIEPLLADAHPEVRREAVLAMGQARHPRVKELLVAQILRDTETRPHAIRALGELGDSAVAPLLAQMLGDESPLARMAIVEALAELNEPTAEPLLVRLLVDQEPEVRRSAVEALARFGTPTAIRHGVAAARDAEWQVRAAAVELLALRPEGPSGAALERLCFDPVPFVADLARRRLDETKPI